MKISKRFELEERCLLFSFLSHWISLKGHHLLLAAIYQQVKYLRSYSEFNVGRFWGHHACKAVVSHLILFQSHVALKS